MTTTEATRRMSPASRIADSWATGDPRVGDAHRATATRPANVRAATANSTAVTAPIPVVGIAPTVISAPARTFSSSAGTVRAATSDPDTRFTDEAVDAAESASAPHQGPALVRRLGDWVLNALAVFGVLCIALTVAAVVGNYTIIMFKTGSMDPTIPQGAIAVVHQIPATEVRVGDVITVDREVGEKPITHRVIGVEPLGGGEMLISMQGDANPNPDPEPYRVSEVRKVVWSAPGLAKYIVWFSNPFVLGGITLGAALLVLCVFWPRRSTTSAGQATPSHDFDS